MPNMFCIKPDEYINQCVSEVIIEEKGSLPISKIHFMAKKPKEKSSRSMMVNDFFYNHIKEKNYNISGEELKKIFILISFLYKKVTKENKHKVLIMASRYCNANDVNINLQEGVILKNCYDYVNFYDHSYHTKCFRERMIP